MDPANDPLIHDGFADEFCILHARQQLYVDPLMTDTLSREAEFSMQRYYNNGLITIAAFVIRMWWLMYIGQLREVGRKFWELERARSTRSQKALSSEPESGSTEYCRMKFWCRTRGQCAAVTEYIAESLFHKVAQDIMVDTPGVRELKVEHGFQAHDE